MAVELSEFGVVHSSRPVARYESNRLLRVPIVSRRVLEPRRHMVGVDNVISFAEAMASNVQTGEVVVPNIERKDDLRKRIAAATDKDPVNVVVVNLASMGQETRVYPEAVRVLGALNEFKGQLDRNKIPSRAIVVVDGMQSDVDNYVALRDREKKAKEDRADDSYYVLRKVQGTDGDYSVSWKLVKYLQSIAYDGLSSVYTRGAVFEAIRRKQGFWTPQEMTMRPSDEAINVQRERIIAGQLLRDVLRDPVVLGMRTRDDKLSTLPVGSYDQVYYSGYMKVVLPRPGFEEEYPSVDFDEGDVTE